MKKRKKLNKLLVIILIFGIILFTKKIFATTDSDEIGEIEYSEEFSEWLELDDETKENSIMPRTYSISSYRLTSSNPIRYANLVKASISEDSSSSTFSLKTYIEDNMVIKNQGDLGSCWAFAALGALETNLALQDYYDDEDVTVYDYSEMHLEYATADIWPDGTTNESGFARSVGDGGNAMIASAYLTNGTGAIDEDELEYNDDTSNAEITLDDVQNVTVTSQIYDTVELPSDSDADVDDIMVLMKEHIQNYGGIYTHIYEPSSLSETCLNYENGALYCSSSTQVANHAVLIVGWDDDYSVSNFSEDDQPENNGAWIVRDSHGDEDDWFYEYTLEELLEDEAFASWFSAKGVTSTEDITEDVIESLIEALNEQYPTMGYTGELKDDTVYIYYNHNDNGYLYVSYEDINVYSSLMGIVKSSDSVDYDYIYQYDEYGVWYTLSFNSDAIYLANVFEKETDDIEYLTQVAINVPETSTCSVYVNPDGTSTAEEDLISVPLEAGDSETFDAGYHTLEFAYPVELTGTNFVVVIKQDSYDNDSKTITCGEGTYADTAWENVTISSNCYYTTESGFSSNSWSSFGSSSKELDSSIKALTVTSYDGETLDTSSETEDNDDTEDTEDIDESDEDEDTENSEDTDESDEDEDAGSSDDTDETEDAEDTTSSPKNSDFENSSTIVNSMKLYSYTDGTEGYFLINITIEDIERYTSENDSYTYYYYLSDSQVETDIEDWIEITEEQTSSDSLTFTINSSDLSNYSELSSASTLYLYIKEVAVKDEVESTVVSDAILLSLDESSSVTIEYYLDDVLIYSTTIDATDSSSTSSSSSSSTETTTSEASTTSSSSSGSSSDDTTSTTSLPYTGEKLFIVAGLIIIFIILGVVFYKKYNKLNY